jgi:hypothetical protein
MSSPARPFRPRRRASPLRMDALVRDMQAAIREADAFLANLPQS